MLGGEREDPGGEGRKGELDEPSFSRLVLYTSQRANRRESTHLHALILSRCSHTFRSTSGELHTLLLPRSFDLNLSLPLPSLILLLRHSPFSLLPPKLTPTFPSASRFMAVSHIVGQELEKEAAADEALAASSALASSGPAAAAPPSEGEAEDSLIM